MSYCPVFVCYRLTLCSGALKVKTGELHNHTETERLKTTVSRFTDTGLRGQKTSHYFST